MEQISTFYLTQGVLGVSVICLIFALIHLYRENKLLNKELVIVQEKWRLSETERADRLMETVNTASAVQSALIDKIEIGRGK